MNKEKTNKSFLGILSAVVLLSFGKLKYLLVLVKLLKLQTLLSMILYLGTYALLYGWKFAAALVYLLFVHEMGHAYAAKKINLPTSPALFIPFLGAVIGLKEPPKNARDEGFVAYMGPVFGLLSFLPAIPLYMFTGEPFWALVIILGGILNLFNLIPITPLDGGRIIAGISTKLWGIGLVMLLAFSIMYMSIIGFLIVLVGAFEWHRIYKRQKNLKHEEKEVSEYLRTYDTLLERAEVSDDHFVYYASSVQRLIKNKELSSTFHILDEFNAMPEEAEEEQHKREVVGKFLSSFHEQVMKLKTNYEHAAAYYQTSRKTKVELFLIYAGLVAVLGTSVYFANDILMNSPEVQETMRNR